MVVYRERGDFVDNVYSRAPTPVVPKLEVNLLPIDRIDLAPGFYYIWPLILQ